VEASSQTIGELLEELFPGRDIVAGLERVLTIVERFADRIPAVIEPVLIKASEMAERLDKTFARAWVRTNANRAGPPPPFGARVVSFDHPLGQGRGKESRNATDRCRRPPFLGEARADDALDFPQGGGAARSMEYNVRSRAPDCQIESGGIPGRLGL
jgi:hypothetical protein